MLRITNCSPEDHIFVEGTLVSSTFEKEFGKGKSKITVPFNAWQVKAESIRKLNRARKEQVLDTEPVAAQPEEVPLYPFVFEKGLNLRPFRISVV